MNEQLTVTQLLEKAIQKEIDSQNLYRDLGEQTNNAAARDILHSLVKAEEKHEEFLRKYLNGELGEGILGSKQPVDYRIAEHLEQPEITPEMKLDEVLLMAANREKASHELYLKLAGEHPSGQLRELIEQLAAQELEHKNVIEYLYTEVAFPQTDGG